MGTRRRAPAARPGVSVLCSRSAVPQVSRKKRVCIAFTSHLAHVGRCVGEPEEARRPTCCTLRARIVLCPPGARHAGRPPIWPARDALSGQMGHEPERTQAAEAEMAWACLVQRYSPKYAPEGAESEFNN